MPANFNSQVQVQLQVGFNSSGPNDTGFTWTDISNRMREFQVSRGREFELDQVSPGTALFVLDNNNRDFDPNSTGGAHSPNVDVMKPVRLQAIHGGTTFEVFRGFVESWNQQWPSVGHDAVTVLGAVDGFKVMAFWEVASTSPQELSGTRVGRLLDNISWTTQLRTLDAGDVTCAAFTPSCAYALSELQRVQETEEGLFFMGTDGKATFHDNSHRTASTSIATFTDTGGGLPYTEPVQLNYDDAQIWNDVTVVGIGLTPQAADSTASVDLYGRRKLRRFDTLHHNATSALDTAQAVRDRFKDPVTRVPSITLDPLGSTSLWPHVLGRELSDRVTINRATKSTTTGVYSADHHIEGISHTGSIEQDWTVTWLLSPST